MGHSRPGFHLSYNDPSPSSQRTITNNNNERNIRHRHCMISIRACRILLCLRYIGCPALLFITSTLQPSTRVKSAAAPGRPYKQDCCTRISAPPGCNLDALSNRTGTLTTPKG